MPQYLPDVQQLEEGICQAHVFAHPVLLVSMADVKVERDSMLFPILAGVSEAERGTILEVLKAEPALWPIYGTWLAYHEPAIWREIKRMAAEQNESIALDFTALAEDLRERGDRLGMKTLLKALGVKEMIEAFGVKEAVEAVGVKEAMEAVGVKQAVEAVGVEQTLEAIGEDQIWANLSPERREKLRRLVQQDNPAPNEPTQ